MPLTKDSWHEERLLIDGKLVEAEGGATYENINPANEEVIGVAADASKADLRAGDRRGSPRLRRDRVVPRRRPAGPVPAPAARGAARPPGRARRHHGRRGRRAADADGRAAARASRSSSCPFYADLAENYEWHQELGVADTMAGPVQPVGRAGAGRRGRRDHAVELPEPDQHRQGRAGARRRLHGGAQAGARHAVDGAGARSAGGRAHRHPRRRPQRRDRGRQDDRRGAHHQPRRRHGQLHRLDRGRPADHGGRRRDHQAGLPRAGRQVGPDRPRRRRRHRRRLDRRGVRDLHPRRAGLRHQHPAAAAAVPLRRGRRRPLRR